jgi:hypothetical protein
MLQRVAQRQQFLIFRRGGDLEPINVQLRLATTIPLGVLAAGMLDQDAPHGFRGGAKEVSASVPIGVFCSEETEPGFMHQSGRLSV